MKQLLLAIILLLCLPLFGQQPATFLFGNGQFDGTHIYNVIQDNSFNYWFATNQGIYVFDGYNYEKIECPEMNGNSAFNFVKDENGVIYCNNLNSQVFKIKDKKCSVFFTVPDKGVDFSLATLKNEIVVCTSRFVYILDQKGKVKKKIGNNLKNYFSRLYKTNQGEVLIHESGTSNVYHYSKGTFKKNTISGADFLKDISSVLFFFEINHKLYAFDNLSNNVYLYSVKQKKLELTTKIQWSTTKELGRIYCIDNQLWVANSVAGLQVKKQFLDYPLIQKKYYTDYFISHVFKDHEGNILLSTFDQGILIIPNRKVQDIDPQFAGHKVTKLMARNNCKLYFGTQKGLVGEYSSKGISFFETHSYKYIEALDEWEQGPYLFSDNNALTITNTTTKKSNQHQIGAFKSIAGFDCKNLLIGLNLGVYKLTFNPKTEQFTPGKKLIESRAYKLFHEKKSHFIYANTADGLFSISRNYTIDTITYKGLKINALSMCKLRNSTLISTEKDGLLICTSGKVLKQLKCTYKDELLRFSRIRVENNRIYGNSQFGLMILNTNGGILQVVDKAFGLTENRIIDFELFRDTIWISHSKGIQKFSLKDLHSCYYQPKLWINSLKVNRKLSSFAKKSFTTNQNNFKFELKVPTIRYRENIRYHYILHGTSDNWTINEFDNNIISYSSLSPGKYRFVVVAEYNGVFSEKQFYSFTISAPFYQKWWFYLLILVLITATISYIYKQKFQRAKKKIQQLNELNSLKLTAIQSQMNPHFIFNSLNAIQDLVLKGDVENSYIFITKFSNLVRRTLNYSDKDFIDFEQEIKLIELYLSLEKLRFKTDLEYTINTNEIDAIQIPPMLIQPFIENALLHGLLHKDGIKKLTIDFEYTDVLICKITDNGIGRKKAMEIKTRQRANHESFAIEAIRKRFDILIQHFNGELGYSYEDLYENDEATGTIVTLTIPVKPNY